MAKPKEGRIPATIRIRPELLKATRVAAAQKDVMHVEWVESAFLMALKAEKAK
jgi:hypothetical protein